MVEIYFNLNRSTLVKYKRPLAIPWHSSMVDHHLCPAPFTLFLWECCRSMQIVNLNQSGNHANQYPAYIYWIFFSILTSWSFSKGNAENYWSITRCRVRKTNVLTQELHGHRLKATTSKGEGTGPFSIILGGTIFCQHPGSGWSWPGELDGMFLFVGSKDFE